MLTKDDKNWIEEKLAKEVKPLRDSVDLLRKKVSETSFDKLHSDTRLNAIEASQMRVEEKVDSFDKDITELKVDSKLLQQAILRFERGQDEIHSLASQTLGIVEGLSGKVAGLDQENKMGSITLRRHDVQIHELAKATGTTISD
ncbi:MAG: hypothetical protein AAB794_04085 [Patescibacteria group bacterium]